MAERDYLPGGDFAGGSPIGSGVFSEVTVETPVLFDYKDEVLDRAQAGRSGLWGLLRVAGWKQEDRDQEDKNQDLQADGRAGTARADVHRLEIP
jgi:hypothetical protein